LAKDFIHLLPFLVVVVEKDQYLFRIFLGIEVKRELRSAQRHDGRSGSMENLIAKHERVDWGLILNWLLSVLEIQLDERFIGLYIEERNAKSTQPRSCREKEEVSLRQGTDKQEVFFFDFFNCGLIDFF
jgi:hypothetical protein